MAFRIKVHSKTRGRCFYCGIHVRCADEVLPHDWLVLRSATEAMMVPDHAHPKSRGGIDGIDNRLPACGACNAAKGWLNVEEYRLVKSIRARNLSFGFACEEPPRQRDWMCVYSEERERELFLHQMPWAKDAYGRSGAIKKRGASWKGKPVR